MNDQDAKLRIIMDHFGMETQIEWLKRECIEFLESGEDEEIADLYVLTRNIILHSPVIRRETDFKIERTLDRMVTGYPGYERKTK